MHTLSAGQGHETLVGTVIGEVLEIDPDRIRVVRPDSLVVAAEPEPGRQPHGDHAGRRRVPRRAEAEGPDRRHCRARPRHPAGARRPTATATCSIAPRRRARAELERARHHRAPPLPSPAARHRTGARRSATSCRCRPAATLPTADGRVQMYPCFAFEFHLILVAIDPDLGKPEIKRYCHRPRLRHRDQSEDRARHDHGRHRPRHRRGAVRGVCLQRRRPAHGAELHGLPAAVVARGPAGRDRPSRDAVAAHRVRPEGLGRESGYLGAPAAIASAVNDAIAAARDRGEHACRSRSRSSAT